MGRRERVARWRNARKERPHDLHDGECKSIIIIIIIIIIIKSDRMTYMTGSVCLQRLRRRIYPRRAAPCRRWQSSWRCRGSAGAAARRPGRGRGRGVERVASGKRVVLSEEPGRGRAPPPRPAPRCPTTRGRGLRRRSPARRRPPRQPRSADGTALQADPRCPRRRPRRSRWSGGRAALRRGRLAWPAPAGGPGEGSEGGRG